MNKSLRIETRNIGFPADRASRHLTNEVVEVSMRTTSRLVQVLTGVFLVAACAAPYLFGPLLAFLLIISLTVVIFFRFTLPLVALEWTLALASLGAFAILRGSIAGYDGALPMASIFVVEPLLLGLLLPMVYRSEADVTHLFLALDIALLAVAGLGFLLYVNTVVGIQLPIGGLIDPRFVAVDLSGDILRTNFQGYNSLVFLAPYAFFRCMASELPYKLSNVRRVTLAVAGLSAIILSGRNILYLSTPLAIIFAWAFTRQLRTAPQPASKVVGRILRLLVIIGVLGLSLSALGLSFQSASRRTMSTISFVDDSGVRVEQSGILLKKAMENPVFGHGAGATTRGYVRDQEAPWNYELSYHSLLVTLGAAGVGLLTAWCGWIIKQLKTSDARIQSRNRCVIAGFVGALLAATSNPYFFKIDGIWMAFVPFAVAVSSYASRTNKGLT